MLSTNNGCDEVCMACDTDVVTHTVCVHGECNATSLLTNQCPSIVTTVISSVSSLPAVHAILYDKVAPITPVMDVELADTVKNVLHTQPTIITTDHRNNNNDKNDNDNNNNARCFDWRTFWKFTGPTWLVACAYIDPGMIQADLSQGAYTGYQLLWVTFWSTVVGFLFQTLAARIGVVMNTDLATATRLAYPRRELHLIVWLFMELAIIGCDIQAVIGTAFALNIVSGIGFWQACLITTAICLPVTILYHWRGSWVEAMAAGCIGVVAICYVVQLGISGTAVDQMFIGWWVPKSQDYAQLMALGTVGSVIMPNVIFLHSHLVLSRGIDRSSPTQIQQANKYNTIDTGIGMGTSFIVNLCIVCVFAAGFFDETCAQQGLAMVGGQCDTIGLDGVGDTLHSVWGSASKYVFAVGMILSGVASVISSTLCSQVIMEGLVQIRMSFTARMCLTRGVTLIPTLALCLIYGTSANSLSILNQWINIGMSLVLPFAMVPVLHISDNSTTMHTFANGRLISTIAWLIVVIVLGVNFYLILGFIYLPEVMGSLSSFQPTPLFYTCVGAALVLYTYYIWVLMRLDIHRFFKYVSSTFMGRCLCV